MKSVGLMHSPSEANSWEMSPTPPRKTSMPDLPVYQVILFIVGTTRAAGLLGFLTLEARLLRRRTRWQQAAVSLRLEAPLLGEALGTHLCSGGACVEAQRAAGVRLAWLIAARTAGRVV